MTPKSLAFRRIWQQISAPLSPPGLTAKNSPSPTPASATPPQRPPAPIPSRTLTNATGLTSDYNVTLLPGTLIVTASFNGILVLNRSASGALNMSDNSVINESRWPVYVNSSSAAAVKLSGDASLTASSIQIVGGYQRSGNAAFHPTPVIGSAVSPDPLATLQAPSAGTSLGAVNLGGKSSRTIQPGTYSQITVAGNANLTLAQGVYVVTSGFSARDNARIKGDGVVIYIASGSIKLGDYSTVLLTPRTNGVYSGVSVFQARSDTSTIYLTGNAYLSSGTLYAPSAALDLSDFSNLSAPLILDRLTLSDHAGPSPTPPVRLGAFAGGVTGDAIAALIKDVSQDLSFGAFAKVTWQVAFAPEAILGGSPSPNYKQAVLEFVLAEASIIEGGVLSGMDVLPVPPGTQSTDGLFTVLENVLGSLDWSGA